MIEKKNMRKRTSRTILQPLAVSLLLLLLPLLAFADEAFVEKLKALPGVTSVKQVDDQAGFEGRYIVMITQPLSHKDPSKGTFTQRVIVMNRGENRPTLLVTEGYAAGYAAGPRYNNELSTYFLTNIVFVEHRYFGESMPQPTDTPQKGAIIYKGIDWQYLIDRDAMADLHTVTSAFKTIYPKKWISTGISKGGETCMEYRSYYPEDVDISVPYVGPVCNAVIDGRHEPFLRNVGTAQQRQTIENYQIELLKRKSQLLPDFQKYCEKKHLSFYIPLDQVYDYCVLEYSFSLWQWGRKVESLPSVSAPDSVLLQNLVKSVGPEYFSTTGDVSFFAQAYRELGYYGYDLKPFRKYLSIKSAKHYVRDVMLPPELRSIHFDKTLSKHITSWLQHNDPRMICIYGETDPWTAAGVTWLKQYPKKNLHVFIKPGGSHSTRINNMPPQQREEILGLLSAWLGEPVRK